MNYFQSKKQLNKKCNIAFLGEMFECSDLKIVGIFEWLLFILIFNSKNKISLGRGLNIDVRIPEISVSRFHANINYNNGHFYL